MQDISSGERDLARLSAPQKDDDRMIKGLNFFAPAEQKLPRAVQLPEFNIHALRRADLKRFVGEYSDSRLSRELHRLHVLGLIKRVARSYHYYLARLGRAAIAAACSLAQFQILPALASARCEILAHNRQVLSDKRSTRGGQTRLDIRVAMRQRSHLIAVG